MNIFKFYFLVILCTTSGYCQNEKIDIIISEKPSDFVWKKGDNLDLHGRIINKSNNDIWIIRPKGETDFYPNLFKIKFSDGFKGNSCVFEIVMSDLATKKEFWKIEAGKEMEFDLKGLYYQLNYCSESELDENKINVHLEYSQANIPKDALVSFAKENYKPDNKEILALYSKVYLEKIKSNLVSITIEN